MNQGNSAANRRQAIHAALQKAREESRGPLSARQLAEEHGVSRQVIVGDIALLRAEGHDIMATPRGYIYETDDIRKQGLFTGKIVCQHSEKQIREELQVIVDNGGQTLDVEVEHPLYGTISSPLLIRSRHDIEEFLRQMEAKETRMLSSLTDGVHLHTLLCPDKETFQRIKKQLRSSGILYE